MPRISVTEEHVSPSQGRLYSIEWAILDMYSFFLILYCGTLRRRGVIESNLTHWTLQTTMYFKGKPIHV